MFRISCLVFGICFAVGCGSGPDAPSGISFSETTGETGYVQLSVHDAKTPSLSESARITQYKVVISGEGLSPVEKLISIDAAGVAIEGIPAGLNRKVEVYALNAGDKILREGVVENLAIQGGKSVTVEIALVSVPAVLNLSDGDFSSNQRVWFKVLTDPGHTIEVESGGAIKDVVTAAESVTANENGEARFYPGIFPAGDSVFKITDRTTQKSSSVTLHLWEGADIKAAPFFSASASKGRLGEPVARRNK
ncbi:MAG: hypothetical protein Q8P84_09105 [Deltaproteobacteria bacterium]|nr:hypothetical protein [Deltaproteobacteria bacterium]